MRFLGLGFILAAFVNQSESLHVQKHATDFAITKSNLSQEAADSVKSISIDDSRVYFKGCNYNSADFSVDE